MSPSPRRSRKEGRPGTGAVGRAVVAGAGVAPAAGVAAGELEPTHVAHVEEAHRASAPAVLVQDAAVGERHVPAGEVDHLCAQLPVSSVQWRLPGHGCLLDVGAS